MFERSFWLESFPLGEKAFFDWSWRRTFLILVGNEFPTWIIHKLLCWGEKQSFSKEIQSFLNPTFWKLRQLLHSDSGLTKTRYALLYIHFSFSCYIDFTVEFEILAKFLRRLQIYDQEKHFAVIRGKLSPAEVLIVSELKSTLSRA